MNVKITVFTPTYNRAYTLRRLYNSLLDQSYKNFEWIIVDDGSTDNTQEVIQKFIDEGFISIIYYKQKNGGKHRAINKGLDLAKGELFFIVDSDDYLTKNSLEVIVKGWSEIKNKDKFCGISGLKGFTPSKVVGNSLKNYITDCSILDYRYKFGIKGDKAEVFVTNILRDNKFPEIEGENFISEAIVWNRLGSKYLMRWINEIIYICDYLDDGLTSKSVSLRIKNIKGTLLLYKSNLEYDIPFKYKLKNYTNYYRFLFHSKLPKMNYILTFTPLNVLGILGGLIMYVLDNFRFRKEISSLKS
ncbi:glycosyltransferase family 2 protein [Tepidanaerobacter sp. GT38]|uniref:glycosyltransferase family A protein n=1 Tax=Tepidanaerobacter sp. GT38 TaxID=2722793 RepID=UPI001F2A7A82|nr:glycosyltransferase family 2 protein [Tepidanaerobacter sp. GT38]MCG1011517.1 glycosyltransferase family 2 protein [Tepidanaerobacter sp. GT38]